ncbi:MAG: hypothetical protein AAGE52_43100, partial [Myxococcota bacterium]
MRSLLAISILVACGSKGEQPRAESASPEERVPSPAEVEAAAVAEAAEVARVLDEEFPLHGLVTRPQLVIRDTPDREGGVVGWLRWGERVRLKEEPTRAPRCASGWYAVAPQGWVCAGQGVTVAPEPPESESPPVPPARREDILPYDYFFVKEPMTAQYHQLPSRSQQ